MTLSFHVQTIPCPEEYYMGVQASADAYFVEVPDELFPKELMNVLKYKKGLDGRTKSCIGIAAHIEEETQDDTRKST